MRKALSVILAATLLMAFAVPAMADFNFSGFYRGKYFISNFERYDAGDMILIKSDAGRAAESITAVAQPFQDRILVVNTKSPTASYFEQRFRGRFEAKTDTVGAVWFVENDARWGDSQYQVGRNQGGAIEADTVSTEMKNIYVWFKPTPNATVNVGIQNFTDAFRGVLLGGADIAGVIVTQKIDPVDLRYGLSIFKSGPVLTGVNPATSLVGQDANNDVQLWILEGHMSPTKEIRAGIDFYFINDHDFPAIYESRKIYTIGLDGSFKASDMLTVSAFVFGQFGKQKGNIAPVGPDIKFGGYAGDIRIDVAAGPGKGFIEGIYITGDDNPNDDKFKGIGTSSAYALAGSYFASTDMEILLPNLYDTNTSQALTYDAANFNQGLIHIGAGYSMPLVEKLTGKIGVGYSSFAKASANPGVIFQKKGQGTEVHARLTYNIAKGLDAGLIGAVVFTGDAYKKGGNTVVDASPLNDKPDTPYKFMAHVNYAF